MLIDVDRVELLTRETAPGGATSHDPAVGRSIRAPGLRWRWKIQDYALIGDCKTAALVGRDGAIDWLCWPRFDSSACFAALLGTAENGRWVVAPVQPSISVSRRYRPGTLVLETEFETESGRATVIDFMPISDEPRSRTDCRGSIGSHRFSH
jgi:GH15 family glucan-1,4-alpha-glucosidase